jgi:hypothetical protein
VKKVGCIGKKVGCIGNEKEILRCTEKLDPFPSPADRPFDRSNKLRLSIGVRTEVNDPCKF